MLTHRLTALTLSLASVSPAPGFAQQRKDDLSSVNALSAILPAGSAQVHYELDPVSCTDHATVGAAIVKREPADLSTDTTTTDNTLMTARVAALDSTTTSTSPLLSDSTDHRLGR